MDWWLIEINEIELERRNLGVAGGGRSGFFIWFRSVRLC